MKKKEEVDIKSQRVSVGLEKLKKGAADVETMKVLSKIPSFSASFILNVHLQPL